jgi:hypothetical protein
MKKIRKLKSIAFSLMVLSLGMACDASPVLPANDAYTLFVGSGQSDPLFYEALAKNLINTNAIKVNLLVLGAVSPLVDPKFSPDESGSLFNFLKNFDVHTLQGADPQIFLMPDVEAKDLGGPKDWTNWGLQNSTALSAVGGPCNFNQNKPDIPYPASYVPSNKNQPDILDVNAAEAQEMMMTVCFATLMNQNLGSTLITGLTYDGQSLVMPSTDQNLQWFKQELNFYATQKNSAVSAFVPTLLGWTHGGINNNVDVSFVEVYDQQKGSFTAPRMTEIAPESSYKMFDAPDSDGPGSQGVCETTVGSMCETKSGAIFPGEQYEEEELNQKNQKISAMGLEGASISMCALASQSETPDSSCDTYATYIDIDQTLENQILQSYLYIFNPKSVNWSPAYKNFSDLNNLFGPIPASSDLIPNPRVVYLFSTQYFGPEKSLNAVPTPCMLNLLDSTSACGIENGFGVWNERQYLQNFKNLTHQFLYYVQGCTDESSCQFEGQSGIYMYDFIPQAWYGVNPKQS